jgi:formate hydrogenlyase subunit 6/NADH:ubiquinone oxidoreductase subunit I
MTSSETPAGQSAVIDRDGLAALIAALRSAGYQVIGPQAVGGAILYEPLEEVGQLPAGWTDEQAPGRYRLNPVEAEAGAAGPALFDHAVGPYSWKRFLFPPNHRLWSGRRLESGFTIEAEPEADTAYAFIGVRACELAALAIQDRVFGLDRPEDRSAAGPGFTEPGYAARRRAAFIVAVNCARAGGTCFCVSMGCGPGVRTGDGAGFDLALTELVGEGRHEFLLETGSPRGALILSRLPHRPATPADRAEAEAVVARTAAAMGREMIPEVGPLLKRSLKSSHWDAVAERCLGCANCTMVCPTCFCSTVEDVTNLDGSQAERWRRWDSCFTVDFSYIHGGSIRRETATRYRQWITHKLAWWHDQFGRSGCTGCGRCITWCPVGIDITEEARAIRDGAIRDKEGRNE